MMNVTSRIEQMQIRCRWAVPAVVLFMLVSFQIAPVAHALQFDPGTGDAPPTNPEINIPSSGDGELQLPPQDPGDDDNGGGGLFGEGDGGFGEIDFGEGLEAELRAAQEQEPDPDEELVSIAFQLDMTVADLAKQISEWAEKPVQPSQMILAQKVSLFNGKPVPKSTALNLLYIALFESKIGVIDKGSHIAILQLQEINRGDVPLISDDEDIFARKDTGLIAEKVYSIRNGQAQTIADAMKEILPIDAKIGVDADSNQLVVLYNIGTLQRVQRLVDSLDIPKQDQQMVTYHLKFADAETVAQLIMDLYSSEEDQNLGQNLFGPSRGRGGSRQPQTVSTSADLRVAFNRQHNSVSVIAPNTVHEQIKQMVENEWDKPVKAGAFTRIYELENSDAIRLRDLLNTMFEASDEGAGTIDFGGSRQTRSRPTSRGGSSGSGNQSPPTSLHPLAGQVWFTADEQKNRLIATVRSEQYFEALDAFIKELDSPSYVNMPELVNLRYADAEDVADQINVFLAERGAGGSLAGTQRGLTEVGGTLSGEEGGGTGATPEEREFDPWWTTGRASDDEREVSSLIGKVRVVPVPRQNGILVLSTPEHRESMRQLIELLDQPGRQVVIAVTIAEISREGALSLGLRWGSSGDIATSQNPDNQLAGTGTITGEKTDLLTGLFTTSTLGVNVNLNATIQALQQDNNLHVLSTPKLFTSDNEEATFFDGQDVPFITDTQFTDTGEPIQSFDYRAVGIALAVRPHITQEGHVDLRMNLVMSSIVPGQTLFGGAIIDRRETSTKVTVDDRQTVVLSGILRQEESDIVRKIPLLGDLPILGAFFRSRDKITEESELVAFVTPIVMNNLDDLNYTDTREHRMLETEFEYTPDLWPVSSNQGSDTRIGGLGSDTRKPRGESIDLMEEMETGGVRWQNNSDSNESQ